MTTTVERRSHPSHTPARRPPPATVSVAHGTRPNLLRHRPQAAHGRAYGRAAPTTGSPSATWAPRMAADIQHHHETVHGIHPDRHSSRAGPERPAAQDGERR